MEHPWYKAALPDKYQEAYDRIQAEQARIDAHIRHRKLDQVPLPSLQLPLPFPGGGSTCSLPPSLPLKDTLPQVLD